LNGAGKTGLSELGGIQPFVQSVAEAIAAALKLEVEIVDQQLLRLGGTGRLRGVVGAKQERGFVNSHVLKTGKSYTVSNPGEHKLCRNCELRGHCFYTAGIFCPIIVDGRSIGLISLISFDQVQRETLLSKEGSFLDFTARMADLLGSKVSEHRVITDLEVTNGQMRTMINSIHEGIISVNRVGIINHLNRSAADILGLKADRMIGRPIGEVLPGSPLVEVLASGRELVEREVVHQIRRARVYLLSTAYPITIDGVVVGAVESFQRLEELQRMAFRLTSSELMPSFDDILGSSPAISQLREKARRVARGSSTGLLEGDSGTGKELFARAVHAESPRAGKQFVTINCSAIPDSLLESELFGYEEGAFTGARTGGKPGKFELANGGTIFLDEIGEMPLFLQAKLLRVLQERKIERVGGLKQIALDVRVIAATNRDLAQMVAAGEFRADLYYRLSVIPLFIPPLRERREDIPVLLNFLLEKYNRICPKEFSGFSPQVWALLMEYNWPGNVREMENVIEYACNLEVTGEISMDSLPQKIRQFYAASDISNLNKRLKLAAQEAEKKGLIEALESFGNNLQGKEKIACSLGISRATLYRKLKEFGVGLKYEKQSRE